MNSAHKNRLGSSQVQSQALDKEEDNELTKSMNATTSSQGAPFISSLKQ
jgi:hypothetical protein